MGLASDLSYVCGTSDEPLIYATLGQAFDAAVEAWGPREALVVRHQGIRWRWRELGEAVDAFAAGLLGLGLEPGDRVGVWSPNNAEWVVAQFATARAGLVLVNVNPAYRTDELTYTLRKTGCRALVLADRFKSSDYVAMARRVAPEVDRCEPGALRAAGAPELRSLIVIADEAPPGMYRFADVPALAPPDAAARLAAIGAACRPDDAINIQFTSGTTGLPKGATLSHFNILNNAWFTGAAMGFSEHDRLCVPVPLYHCFGMVLAVLACTLRGAAMVFPSEAFEPLAVLEAVEAERCTALHGVPTMFIAELEHPEFARFDLSTLRTGIMAGAPCPEEVMRRVIDRMHMREVTICYGMTETSPVSFQTAAGDTLERRVTTVGRVHPHVQVRIVGPDGRVVPRGETGELHTRGYCVMRGYWDDPERTAETIDAAGWLASGDLATLDEAGYCRIVGRLKDMIIRGGENIYPAEIEEFLYRHPKVAQVAVVGVPDARYGEQVAAWICLHEGETATEDELRDFCRERIAHFKVPRYIRFVDALPMTVTGKIQKFVLREQAAEALGLS